MEKGEVSGKSTHLLKELFHASGDAIENDTIVLLPWARGYHDVLNTKNTMIYSTLRTAEREALFQWVGPIGQMTLGVIAKKRKHIRISDASMLSRYKIATIPDTGSERILVTLGVPLESFDRFANATSQVKKLAENRVDAIAYSIDGAYEILQEMGCDIEDYEVVYLLKQSDLYFAFNKQTDPKRIEHLNATLKTLIK